MLLPVLDTSLMVIDNFIQASVSGYQNRQTLFNKDSITTVVLDRQYKEIVSIGGVLHGIFRVNIDFINPNVADYSDLMFVKNFPGQNRIVIDPAGKNHGKGIRNYVTYIRRTVYMWYYDTNYTKFKNKFYYNILGTGVNYEDAIPGSLNNSSIFRFMS